MEFIFGSIIVLLAVAVGTSACLIKDWVSRKKERIRIHNQVSQAIEKINADVKIEGPKGKFRWRHWGRRWVNYSHSIPSPRAQASSFIQNKEQPSPPSRFEDD